MAKKKVTTVTEEVDDAPEVKYDDIHKKDMDEVVADAVTTPDEENVVEKKAKEPKETPKEEKKEEEIEFDPEKLKQEAKDEVKQEMADILTGKKGEEKKDEYEEWAKKVFDETGKPPNWKQAAEFIKDKAKAEIKEEEKAKEKEVADKQEADKKQEANVTKEWNTFIDRELEELYAENKLPRIINAEDKNDPGVVARKALFTTMYETNQKLIAEGKPIEYSVYKIFHRYHKAPNAQPAGADAPISAGSGSGASGAEPEDAVNYKEIHNTPWTTFINKVTGKN